MHWRVLAVVLVAVTAGCGSVVGLGGGPATETVTPAPVPTLEPTPEDPRMGLAPGVDAEGIFDVDYLVQNHVSVATDTSYVWEEENHQFYRARNSTVWSNNSQRIVFENGSNYHRTASSTELLIEGQRQFLQSYEEYGDGDRRYTRWFQIDEPDPIYRHGPAGDASLQYASLPVGPIRRFMDLEEERVARISSVGERDHYRITGTRSSILQYGEVRNFTARMVVREDGLVRSLNVSFETTQAEQEVTISYASRYSAVGNATVTEPGWVPEVRERFGEG